MSIRKTLTRKQTVGLVAGLLLGLLMALAGILQIDADPEQVHAVSETIAEQVVPDTDGDSDSDSTEAP